MLGELPILRGVLTPIVVSGVESWELVMLPHGLAGESIRTGGASVLVH